MGHQNHHKSRCRIIAGCIAVACALACVVCIVLLTRQTPQETSALSTCVNRALRAAFGNVPWLYDAADNLWLGFKIREWAHAVEFLLLGMFVSSAALLWCQEKHTAVIAAIAICMTFSVIDQTLRLFIPGRHFDVLDLGFDALGYGTAIALTLCVALMVRKIKPQAE